MQCRSAGKPWRAFRPSWIDLVSYLVIVNGCPVNPEPCRVPEIERPVVAIGGVLTAVVFLLILVVGFVYEWKKGALEWE